MGLARDLRINHRLESVEALRNRLTLVGGPAGERLVRRLDVGEVGGTDPGCLGRVVYLDAAESGIDARSCLETIGRDPCEKNV
jgi:hypothetical protein